MAIGGMTAEGTSVAKSIPVFIHLRNTRCAPTMCAPLTWVLCGVQRNLSYSGEERGA